MIEVAAVLSAIIRHFADLAIILVLLLINAGVGFWEEHQADNAVDTLRKTLAQKAKVRRDGDWREVEGRKLVRGDVLKLEMGTVVPADVKLIKGDVLSLAGRRRNALHTAGGAGALHRRGGWRGL